MELEACANCGKKPTVDRTHSGKYDYKGKPIIFWSIKCECGEKTLRYTRRIEAVDHWNEHQILLRYWQKKLRGENEQLHNTQIPG